jgi:hypothetical protein
MPQIVCGECAPCRRGDYHICDKLKVQGFQAPGCGQELWVTSANMLIPLPDAFTFEQGALVEPAAVAAFQATMIAGAASTPSSQARPYETMLGAMPSGICQRVRAGDHGHAASMIHALPDSRARVDMGPALALSGDRARRGGGRR